MRIGIDAHSVGMGAGGNETHYENLLRWLARVDDRNEYVFYFSHLNDAQMATYAPGPRFTATRLAAKSSVLRVATLLPWAARRDRLDVFQAQYVLPPALGCKTLLTVADIAYEHFPASFPPLQALRCKLTIPNSIRRADHVLTVSQFSKRDIATRYHVDPDKITVTYHGADAIFRPLDRAASRAEVEKRYGVSGPFILYVGRVQARKNVPRLVEGFAQLKQRGAAHKLLIVGPKDYQFDQLLRTIERTQAAQDIVFTGYVPAEELPVLFNAGELFVYPSLFEGFGLPVVEAMACGTPVITSRGSSLEEVAGDAAWLIDPYETESLTAGLEKLLGDPALRAAFARKGLERSKHFSYEAAARQVMQLYERLGN